MSKPHLNIALKTAIVQSGKKQKTIARLARMSDARLSHIVRCRIEPDADEQRLIAKAIGRPVDEVFPEAVAS